MLLAVISGLFTAICMHMVYIFSTLISGLNTGSMEVYFLVLMLMAAILAIISSAFYLKHAKKNKQRSSLILFMFICLLSYAFGSIIFLFFDIVCHDMAFLYNLLPYPDEIWYGEGLVIIVTLYWFALLTIAIDVIGTAYAIGNIDGKKHKSIIKQTDN